MNIQAISNTDYAVRGNKVNKAEQNYQSRMNFNSVDTFSKSSPAFKGNDYYSNNYDDSKRTRESVMKKLANAPKEIKKM